MKVESERPLVFTLFLHKDWSRQIFSRRDSPELKDLSESAETVIEVNTVRVALLRFLCSVIFPVAILSYCITYIAYNIHRLAGWHLSRGATVASSLGFPCFDFKMISNTLDLALSSASLAIAVGGFFVAVVVLWRCSVGKPFLAFLVFWAKSNTE